jgi:threonine dehydrogenase-like Zn-dependent dehydrogenase
MTVGGGAIARVVSLGSDATHLKKGQLVFVDPMVRGRDDSSTSILLGVHGGLTSGAAVLMQGDWRHGSCAQYARWPLENVHVLDEEKLTTSTSTSTSSLGFGLGSGLGLGYSFHDLAYLQRLLVPMGGLCESVLDVKVGDRVIVAPATGQFGGAAVEVALAMGADVVICGRNRTALTKMRDTLEPVYPGAKIDVVQLLGVVETDVAALQAVGDRGRPIDKYIDFSPAVAAGSTHITSCLRALKRGGKACLMGGIMAGVEIPYSVVMFNDLQICGKFMYERDAVKRLISLVESGRLKFRVPEIKVFGLKEWEKGFETAAQKSGWREMVVFEPGRE